jgi:hypothetical protein
VQPLYQMVDGRERQLTVGRQADLRHDGRESRLLEGFFSEKPYFRW